MNKEGYDASFEFEFTEEGLEMLKQLLPTFDKITMVATYGNGKKLKATGKLENLNFKYKRVRKGKTYKLFKITNQSYSIMQFISRDLEVCNENN